MDDRIEIDMALSGLGLPPVQGGRDWPKMLTAIRSRLEAIARHPKIAGDARCAEIFAEMTTSGDMRHFSRQVDELSHRVAWLLGEAGDADAAAALRRSATSSRSPFERSAATVAEPGGDGRPKPGRTRVRL